ncbi:MAG TPA: ABC transporter substrate-binding protein [Lachnospiraceae bacterium]|nr:ABC transporter substrate-binding protein [Lachnospiraceae bacterium]
MRRKHGFIPLLTVLASLAIALGGCQGDKAAESSKIVVGIAQDLEDSLDPHKAVAAGTKEVLFNIYEGLLKPAPDGNIIPAVAESYEVSEDGTRYSFRLRNGVKFHNGEPVTAEDVKYSIEKSAGMTGDESLIPAFSLIKSVDIEDPSTVVITLSEGNLEFPAYLASANAAVIPASNAAPDTIPIGTGPYQCVSRSPQENLVMKRFDDYWGEKAYIEDVTFKIEANADSVVMDLLGGSIDMFPRLTTSQVSQLSEDFTVYEGTMNLVQALYLNNEYGPLKDVRVRQALCYGTDIDGLLKLAFDGKGVPIGSSMFPSFGKYYMDELNDVYTYDVEKAKELLKEAGYENGFDLKITVPSNYQPHVDTAQVLVEQYKKIGVNASIDLVEWNSWLSDVYTNRDFESTVIGVDASNMTARALLERFCSDAGNNFINFNDARYDETFKKAITTADDEESTALYKELERILAEDAANVYLQDMAEFVALNRKFTGYEFYPMYIQDIARLRLSE